MVVRGGGTSQLHMSRFTLSSYAPSTGSVSTGSLGFETTATFGTLAAPYTGYGLALLPSAAGTYPYVYFLRGGKTGADAQLTDDTVKLVQGLSGLAAGGRVVHAWDGPEGGSNWNDNHGGAASGGVDGFGADSDIRDWAKAYWAGLEMSKADMARSVVYGASRGGMEALLMMALEGIVPKCCILRSPMLHLADWSIVKHGHDAIPGFAGAGTEDFEDLSDADQALLQARDCMNYVNRLPVNIPYLLIWGDEDTTIPWEWIDEFEEVMSARGAEVRVCIIAGGGHSVASDQDNGVFSAQCADAFIEEFAV